MAGVVRYSNGLAKPRSSDNRLFHGGGIRNPDLPPLVPNAIDDEFDGTAIDAKWTNQTGTSANIAFEDSCIHSSSGGGSYRAYQALTGSAWKVRAKVWIAGPFSTNSTQLSFGVHRSANNRQVDFGACRDGASTTQYMVNRYSAWAWSAKPTGVNFGHADINSVPQYWELELASGTLYFRRSFTGYDNTFIQIMTEATASWLTADPDNVFFYLAFSGTSGSTARGWIDWFRRIS